MIGGVTAAAVVLVGVAVTFLVLFIHHDPCKGATKPLCPVPKVPTCDPVSKKYTCGCPEGTVKSEKHPNTCLCETASGRDKNCCADPGERRTVRPYCGKCTGEKHTRTCRLGTMPTPPGGVGPNVETCPSTSTCAPVAEEDTCYPLETMSTLCETGKLQPSCESGKKCGSTCCASSTQICSSRDECCDAWQMTYDTKGKPGQCCKRAGSVPISRPGFSKPNECGEYCGTSRTPCDLKNGDHCLRLENVSSRLIASLPTHAYCANDISRQCTSRADCEKAQCYPRPQINSRIVNMCVGNTSTCTETANQATAPTTIIANNKELSGCWDLSDLESSRHPYPHVCAQSGTDGLPTKVNSPPTTGPCAEGSSRYDLLDLHMKLESSSTTSHDLYDYIGSVLKGQRPMGYSCVGEGQSQSLSLMDAVKLAGNDCTWQDCVRHMNDKPGVEVVRFDETSKVCGAIMSCSANTSGGATILKTCDSRYTCDATENCQIPAPANTEYTCLRDDHAANFTCEYGDWCVRGHKPEGQNYCICETETNKGSIPIPSQEFPPYCDSRGNADSRDGKVTNCKKSVYTGSRCEKSLEKCEKSSLHCEHGTKGNSPDYGHCMCYCDAGWSGETCNSRDVGTCSVDCHVGTTHDEDKQYLCNTDATMTNNCKGGTKPQYYNDPIGNMNPAVEPYCTHKRKDIGPGTYRNECQDKGGPPGVLCDCDKYCTDTADCKGMECGPTRQPACVDDASRPNGAPVPFVSGRSLTDAEWAEYGWGGDYQLAVQDYTTNPVSSSVEVTGSCADNLECTDPNCDTLREETCTNNKCCVWQDGGSNPQKHYKCNIAGYFPPLTTPPKFTKNMMECFTGCPRDENGQWGMSDYNNYHCRPLNYTDPKYTHCVDNVTKHAHFDTGYDTVKSRIDWLNNCLSKAPNNISMDWPECKRAMNDMNELGIDYSTPYPKHRDLHQYCVLKDIGTKKRCGCTSGADDVAEDQAAHEPE